MAEGATLTIKVDADQAIATLTRLTDELRLAADEAERLSTALGDIETKEDGQ
jgi:hypothetical protein